MTGILGECVFYFHLFCFKFVIFFFLVCWRWLIHPLHGTMQKPITYTSDLFLCCPAVTNCLHAPDLILLTLISVAASCVPDICKAAMIQHTVNQKWNGSNWRKTYFIMVKKCCNGSFKHDILNKNRWKCSLTKVQLWCSGQQLQKSICTKEEKKRSMT